MNQRIGRLTVAATLIIVGAAVLIDNIQGTSASWYVAKFWPAVLIMLGLEWVYASVRNPGERMRADGGAIALLIIVALIGASYGSWRGPVRFNISAPNPPRIVLPGVPGFGGVASDEKVLAADLDLSQMKDLNLVNLGSFSVDVREGDKARVELRIRAYGHSLEAANETANRFNLRVDKGSTTTITVEHPVSYSLQSSSFVVTLPKGANVNLRVETSSGSVNLSSHTGNVTVQSSSGSIRAERVVGNADLRSSSGSITALGIQGDLAASASSGSVRAEGIRDSVKANSTSGAVKVTDVGKRVTASSTSGAVSVDTKEVGGDYDLTSSSGSVHLVIPSTAGVTVSARASSGSVSGPSWLTVGEGRNSGSGTQGDGANKVNIRTSSGSITVSAR